MPVYNTMGFLGGFIKRGNGELYWFVLSSIGVPLSWRVQKRRGRRSRDDWKKIAEVKRLNEPVIKI
jgi:hypothetical protein